VLPVPGMHIVPEQQPLGHEVKSQLEALASVPVPRFPGGPRPASRSELPGETPASPASGAEAADAPSVAWAVEAPDPWLELASGPGPAFEAACAQSPLERHACAREVQSRHREPPTPHRLPDAPL
jgi:hypothetical protein